MKEFNISEIAEISEAVAGLQKTITFLAFNGVKAHINYGGHCHVLSISIDHPSTKHQEGEVRKAELLDQYVFLSKDHCENVTHALEKVKKMHRMVHETAKEYYAICNQLKQFAGAAS